MENGENLYGRYSSYRQGHRDIVQNAGISDVIAVGMKSKSNEEFLVGGDIQIFLFFVWGSTFD